MQAHKLLHDTLENLIDADLRTFQWYCTFKNLDGCDPIPRARVHNVSRDETVYQLTEAYKELAVSFTVDVLKKMSKLSLAEELEKKHAASSSSSGSAQNPPPHPPGAPGPSNVAQQRSVVFSPTFTGSTTGPMTININKPDN